MSKNKKSFLKSKKAISVIAGSFAALCLMSGAFFVKDMQISNNQAEQYENIELNAVSLTSNTEAKSLAEKLGIVDMLSKDGDGNIIRFEALQGKPIDIIVDEDSLWEMTDSVKSAIKLAINQYNELFSYINPEYSFRYISKSEYDKNPTSDPFIFVTTLLRINTNGGIARAVTSPQTAESSNFNNGSIDSSSTIVISSTGTISLTEKEIANVIIHEIAHALGFENHSYNKDSIMHSSSSGSTLASNYFSEDVLYALLSCYYNSETNTKQFSEIANYISMHVDNRKSEISEYYKNLDTNQKYKDQEINNQLSQQQIEEQNYQKFIDNVKKYASNNNLKAGNINEIVGNTYIETSIYGQTKTLHFNQDGSYTLEISDDTRYLKCTGNYEIKNNTAVLKGEYFKVENMKYVPIEDIIYFAISSNGDGISATLSNNLTISSVYTLTLENKLSL